jgi:hypothetical protein
MYETAPDQTWEFKGIYLFRCDSIQQCEFYLLEVLFGFFKLVNEAPLNRYFSLDYYVSPVRISVGDKSNFHL